MQQLKDRISTLEAQVAQLEREKEEYAALARKLQEKSSKKYNTLMDNIGVLLNSRRDYVKQLVSDGKIAVGDTDKYDWTLLIWAAMKGHYDIVQLCVNLGADIDYKNPSGKSALFYARRNKRYHCEQLLLFNKLKANVSDNVQNIAFSLSKQNGIIENIMNEIDNIINNESEKDKFMDTLTRILCNIIDKKMAFSDDLLNLCWIHNNKTQADNNSNNGDNDLWKTLMKTCNDIVENGNKKDWYFFRTFILPSNLWYRKRNEFNTKKKEEESKDNDFSEPTVTVLDKPNEFNNKDYLFFKLLEMVKTKSEKDLSTLDNGLKLLIGKNKHDWNKLIDWNMNNNNNNNNDNDNMNSTISIRQDSIVNGIKAAYDESDLIHHTSSSFNSRKFCDFKDYLPKLVLLAHMVDDEYQKSVRNIFNIDKVNDIGYLTNDDDKTTRTTPLSIDTLSDIMNEIDNESKIHDNTVATNTTTKHAIEYTRGPVKLYSRALSKAENEYSNEFYPTSACVLDFNRCTLTFYDIGTLLNALNLFVNKVKYYQSGNIIKIVRCKNTFSTYVNNPGYADIKLNVIIKGNTNNIIGEVQFLLKPMLKFKKQAHNLYSIQRQESFIKSSLELILPRLLDTNKQLLVAANMGNVKKLCEIIVLNNLNPDEVNKQEVLFAICRLGHPKALKFVQSMVPEHLFIKELFKKNEDNNNSIDASVTSIPIFKQFFTTKAIIDKYTTDSSWLVHILNQMAQRETNGTLNECIRIIGYKTFVKHACTPVGNNFTMLDRALSKNNVEMVKKLLSYNEIVQHCKQSNYWLFRLLYHLFGWNHHYIDIIDYVLKRLDVFIDSGSSRVNKFVVNTIFNYRYVESTTKEGLKDNAWDYGEETILSRLGWASNVQILTKLIEYVGDKAFIANVFVQDFNNTTILETSIRAKKVKIIKKLFSYDEIKKKIQTNQYWLHRTLWWLFRGEYESDDETIKVVMDELNLSTKNIVDLITNYRYKEVVAKDKLSDSAWDYVGSNIITSMTWNGNYNAFLSFSSIVGKQVFGKFVFMRDADNTAALECAFYAGKVKMIKYILSLDDVKTEYQSSSYWMYRLCWMYENVEMAHDHEKVFKDILKVLDFSKIGLVDLLDGYEYKEKQNKNFTLNENAVKYDFTIGAYGMECTVYCFVYVFLIG